MVSPGIGLKCSRADRGRWLSPCPPVCERNGPLTKRRGPRIKPRLTASLNPQSSPPASRTVVKPARSVSSISFAICRAITAGGRLTSATASRSSAARWTCASINPGIRVRPLQSMTRASRGAGGPSLLPMRPIRPSSTTTRESGCGSRPVQSSRVACSKTSATAAKSRFPLPRLGYLPPPARGGRAGWGATPPGTSKRDPQRRPRGIRLATPIPSRPAS